MASQPTTGPISRKPYECTGCTNEVELSTNHWGECYPWCDVCRKFTAHKCNEPAPEGFGVPERWRFADVTLIVLDDQPHVIKEHATDGRVRNA